MASNPNELTYPVTFEQVARISPNVFPGEVIDGMWVPDAPRHPRHSAILDHLFDQVSAIRRNEPAWSFAVGNPGVKLGREPDTLLGPDLAVARKDRVHNGNGADGWLDGAPTLAVEIMRLGQSCSDADNRAWRYLQCGGEIVWQIDPAREQVRVYLERMSQPMVLGRDDSLFCSFFADRFKCRIAELFE